MVQTPFQSVFNNALKTSGQSVYQIALATDIPVGALMALQQSSIAQLDVSYAQKLSEYLDVSVADLLGGPELTDQVEIAALYNQLPEHLKARFLALQSTTTEA